MLSKRIARSSARTLIMGGTSFSFPTAPATQGDVLAYHVASTTLLPTCRAWGIATTSTAGVALANTTAATAGVPVQYSPALQLDSTAYQTEAVTSLIERWRIENRPVSGAAVTSALHFLRAQAAGAFASAANITSAGLFSATTGLFATWIGVGPSGSSGIFVDLTNLSSGLGTCSNFFTAALNQPTLYYNLARADGANNIVHAFSYRPVALSIVNAATMSNLLVSWTNSSSVNQQMITGYYTGALWLAGGNSYSDDGSTATGGVHYGAGLNIRSLSAVLTIAAAATTSSTVTIPAGAVVLGVSCRVTTVIPTAATFTIGHAGSTALWGTGISTAATTTNTGAAVPALFAAATSILITPNLTPADNTGRLRICIHYYLPTAPTS